MEEDLLTVLRDDPGVSAFVGDRVSWGERPQGSALPAIVLRVVSGVPYYTLNGDTDHRSTRVQVDCLALTYSAAAKTARSVSLVLSGFSGIVGTTNFQAILQESLRDLSQSSPVGQVFLHSLDFFVYHLPQE